MKRCKKIDCLKLYFEKNDSIINVLIARRDLNDDKFNDLLVGLQCTSQQHVANYLHHSGGN